MKTVNLKKKTKTIWTVTELTDGEIVGVEAFKTEREADNFADMIRKETDGGSETAIFEVTLP